jgi:pyruvate ferredoxin oxidoreductase alpha subunit
MNRLEKKMGKKFAQTGTTAVALAMKQINPDVVAAYPITPQTAIVQDFALFVANGEVDTELITVESEHSAMSACVGASAAGARVMTATSSNGLAFMWEVLYIASGLRLPIVMVDVNRALSGPINIHCDHSDSMGARDSGWIQIFSETSQDVYDNVIQAVRIAEHKDVMLPVMVMMDGFIISHGIEMFEILDDDQVKKFTGEYKPQYALLNTSKPVTMGAFDLFDYYFEHKRQQAEGMENARQVIVEVSKKYSDLSGRKQELYRGYHLDDAEIAIVALGSSAGTIRDVIDEMRAEGHKVGLMSPRIYRPFPNVDYAEALKSKLVVGVLDRSDSFGGNGGPIYTELRSALYEYDRRPKIIDRMYGLGGRDFKAEDARSYLDELMEIADGKKQYSAVSYLGVRE